MPFIWPTDMLDKYFILQSLMGLGRHTPASGEADAVPWAYNDAANGRGRQPLALSYEGGFLPKEWLPLGTVFWCDQFLNRVYALRENN